jgi:hypothetical protein
VVGLFPYVAVEASRVRPLETDGSRVWKVWEGGGSGGLVVIRSADDDPYWCDVMPKPSETEDCPVWREGGCRKIDGTSVKKW